MRTSAPSSGSTIPTAGQVLCWAREPAGLAGRNLAGTTLRGIDLRGVNLAGADLSDADFSQASCQRLTFDGADTAAASVSTAGGARRPAPTLPRGGRA